MLDAIACDSPLISVNSFARQIGRTPVTLWRWQKLGWLDASVNIAGKPYLTRECGTAPEGFYVPMDVALHMGTRSLQTRDMQAEIFGVGGATVATQMLPMIEILRNKMICGRLGATMLPGCTSNVVMPRQDSTVTAQSVPEIGTLNNSDINISQLALSPKRVGASVTFSKQLVFQSTPNIEAVIQSDIMRTLAVRHD